MSLSVRDKVKRKNMGVFVSGRTGSGKSRMLRRLASHWHRVLYVDPTGSFEDTEIVQTHSYKDTVSVFAKAYKEGPFRIAAQYDNDMDYESLFAGLNRLIGASKGQYAPFLLVVDEVDLFSTPNYIEPHLSRLLRYGRHAAMSWAVACRADVETHRDVRMNASLVIFFRQGMLSQEARRLCRDAEIVREDKLPVIGRLSLHDGDGDAVEDENFVAVPETLSEWLPKWEELARMS